MRTCPRSSSSRTIEVLPPTAPKTGILPFSPRSIKAQLSTRAVKPRSRISFLTAAAISSTQPANATAAPCWRNSMPPTLPIAPATPASTPAFAATNWPPACRWPHPTPSTSPRNHPKPWKCTAFAMTSPRGRQKLMPPKKSTPSAANVWPPGDSSNAASALCKSGAAMTMATPAATGTAMKTSNATTARSPKASPTAPPPEPDVAALRDA